MTLQKWMLLQRDLIKLLNNLIIEKQSNLSLRNVHLIFEKGFSGTPKSLKYADYVRVLVVSRSGLRPDIIVLLRYFSFENIRMAICP